MLLAFKGALAVVLVLAWAIPLARKRYRAFRKWLAVPAHLRSGSARRRGHRGTSQRGIKATDWVKVREGDFVRVQVIIVVMAKL